MRVTTQSKGQISKEEKYFLKLPMNIHNLHDSEIHALQSKNIITGWAKALNWQNMAESLSAQINEEICYLPNNSKGQKETFPKTPITEDQTLPLTEPGSRSTFTGSHDSQSMVFMESHCIYPPCRWKKIAIFNPSSGPLPSP